MTPKLLIVDDDLGTIRLLNEALRGAGDLFFATRGPDAIRIAQDKKPDVILLDAEMPGMDGYEVCAALKANPATADATIIFVTAHTDIEHETRALDLGAMDFINKPISPPVVRARVRNHIAMKTMADALRQLATTDGLTGLPNRRMFESALDQEWRRARRGGKPLALLMVDVDHFKNYNDSYGHPAGDACLRIVAQTLRICARRPSDVVARYGGEEFVILLPDTDLRGGIQLGERLCAALREMDIRHETSPVSTVVTASVGVAAATPSADAEADDLVKAADEALYQAKAGGRNRVGRATP